mmetsp:Transcript_3237/g.3176  ORF Transcript_3237/g.3176 Transcript_3237/m.3176 type:complete len:117 (-) Transcript_3237:466-816(-)
MPPVAQLQPDLALLLLLTCLHLFILYLNQLILELGVVLDEDVHHVRGGELEADLFLAPPHQVRDLVLLGQVVQLYDFKNIRREICFPRVEPDHHFLECLELYILLLTINTASLHWG